jgi:hypothetical protein
MTKPSATALAPMKQNHLLAKEGNATRPSATVLAPINQDHLLPDDK